MVSHGHVVKFILLPMEVAHIPPMEGEWGPSLPLRTRVTMVNNYITSNGGRIGSSMFPQKRVNMVT